ncbi:MAG: glycosyltransferase family 4 protein [Anaerolineales bacterium]|nr:glycosyltransferase family 4 protein [Anaerolineales bacterium]
MRVLWLTYTPPLPVTHKLGIPNMVSEGWVDSLRLAFQDHSELKLGIASPSEIDYSPFNEDGTEFHNIPSPSQKGSLQAVYRRWSHKTEFPNGINRCLAAVKKFEPDIIHVHGSENFYGLIAKEISIPVVISIQGILTVYELFYFGCLPLKEKLIDVFSPKFIKGAGLIHKYLAMRKSARRERQIIKDCKYFIGRTDFDKNFLSITNPTSHYYHCNEVLRPSFYSAEWTPKSMDSSIVYCISSIPVPYKGLDCLLKACSALKQAGFPNLQMRISGQIQGSDIWGVIKRKVQELNLTKEITWLGKSSAETIVSELKNANVFVLPSYIENSPNSLGEAMLAGVPSIASYVGGVPSMIVHGKDGLLFPSGDYYSLAGMIATILKDPALARTLSNTAKISARKRHDPKTIAQTMMSIYSNIIEDASIKRKNNSI